MKKRSEFSPHILKLRDKSLHLTQAEFAKILHVSRSTINAWERGATKPLSSDLVKLSTFTKDDEEAAWFLKKAGIDDVAMVAVGRRLRADIFVRPKKGELVRVRPLREASQETEVRDADRRLPGELLPSPMLTRYLIVDEESMGYGFEIGDILFVDTSYNNALNLLPFWGQRVLLERDMEVVAKPAGCTPYERMSQIVGRLILKDWGLTPDGFSWMALLQPWNDQLVNILQRREDTGEPAQALWIGTWRCEARPEATVTGQQIDPDFLESSRKEAEKQLHLDPGCRILGRVIGWFRPPREGK